MKLQKQDLRIGIYGAGKVGCAIALAFHEQGIPVTGIYSRNEGKLHFLQERMQILIMKDREQLIENSDVVFIMVPDGVIQAAAEELSEIAAGRNLTGKTFFHCSGALTSEALQSLAKLGAETASFHPIQTFADYENGWKGLNQITFGFEGSDPAQKIAAQFCEAFQSTMLVMEKENKPLYHAAACVLSNYTVTLAYLAGELFEKIGIPNEMGTKALIPLLEKTVENIKKLGSVQALTGPISRGDAQVIESHVSAISAQAPEILELYRKLGACTVELSLKKGSIDHVQAEKVCKVL